MIAFNVDFQIPFRIYVNCVLPYAGINMIWQLNKPVILLLGLSKAMENFSDKTKPRFLVLINKNHCHQSCF